MIIVQSTIIQIIKGKRKNCAKIKGKQIKRNSTKNKGKKHD